MNPFKYLILQGFPNLAIINIDYRLPDANNQSYPMQMDDITSTVNHLKSKAQEYIFSNNIGFIGVSAGAHLSLLGVMLLTLTTRQEWHVAL
jgi:acetyl esterase/lipase